MFLDAWRAAAGNLAGLGAKHPGGRALEVRREGTPPRPLAARLMGGYRPTAARRTALAPALCALAALCSAGPRAADAAAPEAPFFPSKLAIVKDAVGPVRGRKVADVGCGTGELTREMAVESGAEHVWYATFNPISRAPQVFQAACAACGHLACPQGAGKLH